METLYNSLLTAETFITSISLGSLDCAKNTGLITDKGADSTIISGFTTSMTTSLGAKEYVLKTANLYKDTLTPTQIEEGLQRLSEIELRMTTEDKPKTLKRQYEKSTITKTTI